MARFGQSPNFFVQLLRPCSHHHKRGACQRIRFLCQGKAKSSEKAEFIGINEHFELNLNASMVQKDILGNAPRDNFSRPLPQL
jgi:hypothetical protein